VESTRYGQQRSTVLESITFENDSRLTRIEPRCFAGCNGIECIDCVLVATNQARIRRSLEAFERIKGLVAAQLSGLLVGILLDVDRSDIEIPAEIRPFAGNQLHFYTSAEALVLPDWIDVIGKQDFRSCPALREVIVGLHSRLREIHGFRNCPLLESIEIRSPVELIGREAFTHSTLCRFGEKRVLRRPIFIVMTDEALLWRSRRRYHLLQHHETRQNDD
jgi:hypothetical protein